MGIRGRDRVFDRRWGVERIICDLSTRKPSADFALTGNYRSMRAELLGDKPLLKTNLQACHAVALRPFLIDGSG